MRTPLLCWFLVVASVVAAPGRACTIYVTHAEDASLPFWTMSGGSDNKMLLREAAEIAYGDSRCFTEEERLRIEGGNFYHDAVLCGTVDPARNWRLNPVSPGCGPNDADTIRFWDAINGGTQINMSQGVRLHPRDSIDGGPFSPGARANITLDGPGSSAASSSGISFFDFGTPPTTGSVRNLYIRDFRGSGIHAFNGDGFTVKGVTISSIFPSSSNLAVGISIGNLSDPGALIQCVRDIQIGGTGPGEQNYIFDIGRGGNGAGYGIHVWDSCDVETDRNNKIFNNYIGLCEELDTGVGLDGCPGGTPDQAIAGVGIVIRNTPNTRIGGPGANEGNTIGRGGYAGIVLAGANTHDTDILGNRIGYSRTFTVRPNARGVSIDNGASRTRIGGTGTGEGNVISGNSLYGVGIFGGDAHAIVGNVVGLNPTRTANSGNGGDGILLGGATTNARVSDNVIGANGAWGMQLEGGSGALIERNVIGLRGSANSGNDNSVAANVAGGIWNNGMSATQIGAGNRIAGNGGPGVRISGETADGIGVIGNVIGLDNGGSRKPNQMGVHVLDGADGVVIGGAGAVNRNVISANTEGGVRIEGASTTGTLIRNNYIGLSPAGTGTTAGNGGAGVWVLGGAFNTGIDGCVIGNSGNDGVKFEQANTALLTSSVIGMDATASSTAGNGLSGVSIFGGSTAITVGQLSAPNIIAGNGGAGLYLAGTGSNNQLIEGNQIGTTSLGNNGTGVIVTGGAKFNTLARNSIVGNGGVGVEISGAGTTSNTLRGNRIGLTATNVARPNQGGINIFAGASNNTIGGIAAGDANVVSGNAQRGIALYQANTANNVLIGNLIGTTIEGTGDRGNAGPGVMIQEGARDTVLSLNTISGNAGDGVLIRNVGTPTLANRLDRNRIGTAVNGIDALGNDGAGVRVTDDASNTRIGGQAGSGNVIRFNASDGVWIESGLGNEVSYNSIAGNGGLGIDLGADGVNVNDTLDQDNGANGLLNFPRLEEITRGGGMVSMRVLQSGEPAITTLAQVFYGANCDPSGFGEGENYLGEVPVSNDAQGVGQVTVMFPLGVSVQANEFTTSAVRAGNTSEFSPCEVVTTLSDPVMMDGFEGSLGLMSKRASALPAPGWRVTRTGPDTWRLTAAFVNAGTTILPGHMLDIGSDRAVVLRAVRAEGAACAPQGALTCAIAELAPGQHASIEVDFGTEDEAVMFRVDDIGADGGTRTAWLRASD